MTAVGSRLYSLWSWYRSLDHLYGLLPDLRSLVNECCIQHASIHMAHVLIIVDRHEIYNQIRWTMSCVLHGYFDIADPESMVLCPRGRQYGWSLQGNHCAFGGPTETPTDLFLTTCSASHLEKHLQHALKVKLKLASSHSFSQTRPLSIFYSDRAPVARLPGSTMTSCRLLPAWTRQQFIRSVPEILFPRSLHHGLTD